MESTLPIIPIIWGNFKIFIIISTQSFPLFQLIVTDGCGRGRPIMYSLSSKETTADVVGVFKDFESIFGDISRVETITMDCSAALMKAVREVFLW